MSRRRGAFRDNTSRRATTELSLEETGREIKAGLRTLNEREGGLLRLRFGLGGDRQRTYDEIGQFYGVTGERIRRIEAKALDKLRDNPECLELLADALAAFSVEDFTALPHHVQERALQRPVERPQIETRFCEWHGALHDISPYSGARPCGWCTCLVDGPTNAGGRPRSYCSDACKQAAYRHRQKPASMRRPRSNSPKNFTQANLISANLSGANLLDAEFFGADLTGADLSGANLTHANLSGANLTRANLTRANLTGAYLIEADLTGANLTSANLVRADLTRANLTRARFPRADLTRARIRRANLTGARLATSTGLVPHQVSPQQQSAAASLPPHLRRKNPPLTGQ